MDAFRPLRKEEICPSMDIRNTARNLSELEGCRVVEGFLHIVLMEQPDSGAEFNNHTYPKLREITGYLLLYRVFGLRSIGQLFPNLAVIRGQQLLFDFSFVVYEMMQLQEIGLKSLIEVQRGSVLIEKNPNLCYAESIDWGRIGNTGRHNHFIQGNKKASECPRCPDRCSTGGDGRRLCWNNDECQKVCDHCGSGVCSAVQSQTGRPSEMRCCHPECAGGCSGGNQSNQCDVCKHVIHDKECKAVCPPGFYLFMKRRCVKDTECIRMPVPHELSHEYPDVKWNWKVFESVEVAECILECPPGFQEQPVHHNSTLSYYTCVQCKGPCPKFCKGAFVNNIETAQKLRGCTTIMGNLDLQIKGGDNIIQELERSLGSIEEIRGKLKIVSPFPLLSLSFFKNLRNITGGLERRAFSFEDEIRNSRFQLRDFLLAGAGSPHKEVPLKTHEPIIGWSYALILLVVVASLIVVVAVIAVVVCCRAKKKKDKCGTFSVNPNYQYYVRDDWEVDRENVDFIRELGRGTFGLVYEGLLRDPHNLDQPEVKCAIKTVNERATTYERKQILKEANIMKELNAHHVVKLLGVVAASQPTLIIMEFMANGDLKSYLRSHRPDCEENIREGRHPPTLKCLLNMAIEIADGMLYLSKKRYVHRDLAARNCMVAGDLTVKIGDFGMTRKVYNGDCYKTSNKGLSPVRWMAPESLRYSVFNWQSDVWSFGIVLWEMLTWGSCPYQSLAGGEVAQYIINGGVMERPIGCSDRLYNLMKSCWQYRATRRPTFIDIIENLLPDVRVHFLRVSYYSSNARELRSALDGHYHTL